VKWKYFDPITRITATPTVRFTNGSAGFTRDVHSASLLIEIDGPGARNLDMTVLVIYNLSRLHFEIL